MKNFESYLPESNAIAEEGSIPKKIFMTWSSHQLSDAMYDNIQLWIKYNPDWELNLYDDQECIEFIKSNFDKEVFDAYNNLFPTAYKADLFRYCLLYKYGGAYTDVKMVPLKPLAEIVSKDVDFMSAKDRLFNRFDFDGYIYQAFIYAKPQHPFFEQAIKMIVDNSKSGYYGNDPLCPTGPGLLGKAVNICCDRPETSKIEPGTNNINKFKFELLVHGDNAITDVAGTPLIMDRYNEYKTELHRDFELARRYNACWYIDAIYVGSHKPKSKTRYLSKSKLIYKIRYIYLIKIMKVFKKTSKALR